MTNIKVVIGCSFGDCGKGLMTDYFCNKATFDGNCIVVLSNGGCQRSHTVTTPDGKRHAFRHFGSGTFVGADTYYPKQFIVNPMFFKDEYLELKALGYEPIAYMHPDCMFTTPFDMIINQLAEEYRGDNRHGSCGMGIWETIVRDGMTAYAFSKLPVDIQANYLCYIRDIYLSKRLKELGINDVTDEWKDIINSKALMLNYIQDFNWMVEHIVFKFEDILRGYDNVVFENGQGLLLDQNIEGYGEHTTPSNTGIKNPLEIINSAFEEDEYNLEVCYVTRSYMTRHGAGRFDTECKKEDINPDMEDLTNVPNPHQGALRYGWLDFEDLLDRVKNDAKGVKGILSLAVTHQNEYKLKMNSNLLKDFSLIYESDGCGRNSVTCAM